MHKSFTGTGRKQRQINLSGRPSNTNPFAARGGPQSTTAKALDERAERQHQQALSSAARKAQRLWRGRIGRQDAARRLLDDYEQHERAYSGKRNKPESFQSFDTQGTDQALLQLRRLLGFFDSTNDAHVEELLRLVKRLSSTSRCLGPLPTSREFSKALMGLGDRAIVALTSRSRALSLTLRNHSSVDVTPLSRLCKVLLFVSDQIPQYTVKAGASYYGAIGAVLKFFDSCADDGTPILTDGSEAESEGKDTLASTLESLALSPLTYADEATRLHAYFHFIGHIMSSAYLSSHLQGDTVSNFAPEPSSVSCNELPPFLHNGALLNRIADRVDCGGIAAVFKSRITDIAAHVLGAFDSTSKMHILASYIYFKRRKAGSYTSNRNAERLDVDQDFVLIASQLLGSISDEERAAIGTAETSSSNAKRTTQTFVSSQLSHLADEDSVRNLLAGVQASGHGSTVDATLYAIYALTLIRTFPEAADQVRMWLFLGPKGSQSNGREHQSAIRFFWQAARNTNVFSHITRDSQSLQYIVLDEEFAEDPQRIPSGAENDWRVIFMFLELYTFVLKVMDDDEFFSVDSTSSFGVITSTRASALPLKEVEKLVAFLRNLGLSLFLDVGRINTQSTDAIRATSIADFFRKPQQISNTEILPTVTLKGPTGASMDYFQGLVTGLLRLLYERDSRRTFLPQGHWLMNRRFELLFNAEDLFKQLVQLQVHRDEDGNEDEDGDGVDNIRITRVDNDLDPGSPQIYGFGQAERIRHHDTLRLEQKRANNERQRIFLKPRFGVMDNMPYTIPFMKRVNLFHDFVKTDKIQRRYGYEEPDYWRVTAQTRPDGREILMRQQADIRRGHEMEDAYTQFFPIGEHLKEPIQITFLDEFENPEAGIDGGGVTKEFLTSVTKQIKYATGLEDLFAETKQNLLYPNETTVDSIDETNAGNNELQDYVRRRLLNQYEFVGRIIGKCLYEDILVDLTFAPFFLQKWALAADSGRTAGNYRATLDDLRQFDEDLYRGLLRLKSHTGDVEGDFDLDFTIIDDAKNYRTGKTKHIVRDLIPFGSEKKVTNENRLLYIFAVAKHRLAVQQARQTAFFLNGLSMMIKPQWLRMFNQSELQTLLRGTSAPIDIEDLRNSTNYNGLYVIGDDRELHPVIKMFWRVFESLEEDDKRAVLKFVTSTPRAPLMGFRALSPPFTIRDSSRDQERLPTASTCVNLLKLPLYESESVMREKLLYAVTAGAGFDLS